MLREPGGNEDSSLPNGARLRPETAVVFGACATFESGRLSPGGSVDFRPRLGGCFPEERLLGAFFLFFFGFRLLLLLSGLDFRQIPAHLDLQLGK